MLRNIVFKEIKEIVPSINEKLLLTPNRSELGDYAVNIKALGENIEPATVTATLNTNPLFSEIKIVNGFINFFLSLPLLLNEVDSLIKSSKKQVNNKKILFEFGDPNTHKLPHIGHFFSYFFGEACCRLLEANGNTVYRANYQGDIGLHVAKTLYSHMNNTDKPSMDNIELFVRYLQKCYQDGSKLYEENDNIRKEIDELNKKIYQKDQSIVSEWKKTRDINLIYYRALEKQFGIKYDKYYYESNTFEQGIKIVKKNIGVVFEQSDGAIIFKGEHFGLHTRVFINKHGNPTYEGKDVGLIFNKIKDFKFDLAVVDTASEQNEYWKVVKKAIELVFPKMKNKIVHLGHGMISLKSGGKMSSRTGNIISALDLITEIRERIKKKYYENKPISNKELQTLTLASLKYAFLKSDWRKNMTFDIDESISLHGNSGLYIMYTFARCRSILTKSNEKDTVKMKNVDKSVFGKYEMNILRHLIHYQETLSQGAKSYAPHLLCTFLYQLAQKYNDLYEHEQILKANKEQKKLRLFITHTVSYVLKHGLNILGIQTLEKL